MPSQTRKTHPDLLLLSQPWESSERGLRLGGSDLVIEDLKKPDLGISSDSQIRQVLVGG